MTPPNAMAPTTPTTAAPAAPSAPAPTSTSPEAYARALERYRAKVAESGARPDGHFETLGFRPLDTCYGPTPAEAAATDYLNEQGFPGEFPYTRGIHPNLYRGKLWTMRQFAGFGSAADTNARYKYLLERGQTGLSVAFDMPTLMGYDSDHSRSLGEVGKCGVSIASLSDMERLFEGIPLDKVSVSMTINGPAPVIWAFFIAAAEKQGVPRAKLSGTTQADILKEYQAQKEYLFPPRPSIDLVVDTIEFATKEMPRWHPLSISGYHIREAGSTALQELVFTLGNGFAYVEGAIARGVDVDAFAPRLSYFWNSHSDFFEEIAKFRAARRIFARRMRDVYGAKNPKSMQLKFHTQTAGCSLTAQQPENNIVRTAIQALAAVMGGTQSLHTNSLDETLALPTEKSVKIALRTQQVIAEETGVPHVVDPLGGSYYVEALTDAMEEDAMAYFARMDKVGGIVAATEKGWVQREIGEAAYRLQREYEAGKRRIVGVNAYVDPEEKPPEILKIDESVAREQATRLAALRARRDAARASSAIAAVQTAAKEKKNVMPSLIDAAKADCTLGEICDALKAVLGTWREGREF
jgi:methylmalonyl-CoA mutase N-terminal domain/subunit